MKQTIGTITRHTITLLLICAFAALTASAQTADKQRANSLVDGAWALQFEIDEDLDLKTFEGTTISLKKHTNDDAAWRLALNLGFRFDDDEHSSTTDGEPSGINRDTEGNQQSIGILVNRIRYPNPNAEVNFFYGFGPKLAYSHTKYTTTSIWTSSTQSSESRTSTNSFSVGIVGLIGAEWFATKSISLLGEYGSALMVSKSKTTNKTTTWYEDGTTRRTGNEDKDSGISFDALAVKLGLSVYF